MIFVVGPCVRGTCSEGGQAEFAHSHSHCLVLWHYQEKVRGMLPILHKYDFAALLTVCEEWLNKDTQTFSATATESNFVLR